MSSDDVFTVDLNPVFCPDAPLCRPILDGTVVWRDSGHLSPELPVERRDDVWKVIARTGALDGLMDG